jgi:membrane-associated phospholipid phosphatase
VETLYFKKNSKNIFVYFIITVTILNLFSYEVLANKKHHLTRTGDILQITNPIIAGVISTQEKGLGHFAIIYGESLAIMGISKLIGMSGRLEISKRPSTQGGKCRFDGFPSGHTTSAWSAASYVRVFSENHKMLAIPLYAAAGLTGYSRVKAKQHTVTQVLMACGLSEAVTMINAKMKWSNEYKTTDIGFSPNGFLASFKIKL